MAQQINTTELLIQVKKYNWLYIFIGIMAVILIVSAVLKTLTVPPPPFETVINSGQELQAKISFGNVSVEIPNKLTVYSSQTAKIDTKNFAQDLADKLNLRQHPLAIDHWVNTVTDEALYFEDQERYIAYSPVYVDATFASLPAETVENIKNSLLGFINKNQLLTDVQISEPKFTIISTEGFELTENFQEANGYTFTITKRINDLPFYQDTLSDDLATVWTDLSGRIIKIRFSPVSFQLQEVNTYNSLSLGNIENYMKEGLITYIRTQPLKAQKDNSQNLIEVQFDKAVVEYRQNTENGYILPYVRFTGIGKDKDLNEYYVEAISPAVKVE